MTANPLELPTLVLNRNWQPVNVSSVARSLVLLWNGSARVVDPETYQLFDWGEWLSRPTSEGAAVVRAVRFQLGVPEVIVLSGYDRLPSAAVTFSRRNVYKRDRFTCQYCGTQPGYDELTIDHVVPRAQGGESRWDNCVLACLACNHRKADRTPAEARMKLRQAPHQPHWNPGYAAYDTRRRGWERFVGKAALPRGA